MNQIERQILKNQQFIINVLGNGKYFKDEKDAISLAERWNETKQLLNPKQTEESACDMEENAKRGREK